MRVVFMGTPAFAVPALRALASSHEVVAVYTRADAASGRGKTLLPSPVKVAAEELGIQVRQPRTLRDEAEVAWLAAAAPDVVVVAAFGMILPREVLEIPRLGCVNVHASLLPRWRGAAPIQRAILAGDERTGVSIMRMEEGLDTGDYCSVVEVPVDDKTTDELSVELAQAGAAALLPALSTIEDGTVVWTPQDESLVTYADKIEKADVALSPADTVEVARRKVRAASAQAPARLLVNGRGAAVTSLEPAEDAPSAGSIACSKRALVLGFADGAALAAKVKPEGKGEMPGCDWARGARFESGAEWTGIR
ncbi:MAG TPA: methionyl-tRNA formyltransferase [Coriobacteriia bacterium]|nr:methionyl-tRNA formyltransferase [Coriobacteriia bacterium]